MTAVVAFKKAGYGDASLDATRSDAGQTIGPEETTETEIVMKEDGGKTKTQSIECDGAEIITSDDAEMSVGDSDGKETGSDGTSEGSTSSRDGESVTSQGSRKRPGDESPERETVTTTRKEFPGNLTRSNAGCRIYVPVTGSRGAGGVG